MSRNLTSSVNYWKILERKLRGNDIFLPAWDKKDRDTLIQSLILTCLVLEEDLLLSDTCSLRRDLLNWIYFILKGDPVQSAELSGEIFQFLVRLPFGNTAQENWIAWSRFKASELKRKSALVCPIMGSISRYLDTRSAGVLRVINQFLTGPWKVHYPSLDYSQKCLSQYVAQEEKNRNLRIDPVLLRGLNHIVIEWCRGIDFTPLHPMHGPGSVAEVGVRHMLEKYTHMDTDEILNYSFPDPLVPFHRERTLDRACRIVFVPKSIKTWRTISAEPASLMFHQQAVLRVFEKLFRNHSVLRNHVFLHDSSVNRNAAREGSVLSEGQESNFCTIDLSAASDCVTWQLVKAVFAHTPLLRYLVSTRSRFAILPDGQRLELFKFAPMGSAVCFPVETMVFAACCELIVRLYGDKERKRYLVYGDDIILDTHLSEPLIELLEKLGFVVNKDKSFYSREVLFRESCGGEFYDGVDITPLRLPRKFSCVDVGYLRSADTYSMGIDLINRCYSHEKKYMRSYLISKYQELPQRMRPLFSYDGRGGGIISDAPTNFHLKSVTDESARKLQGTTWIHGCIRTTVDTWYPDDDWGEELLYEWLRGAKDSKRREPLELCRAEGAAKVAPGRTTLT